MERINYKITGDNCNISIRALLEKLHVGKSNIYKLFLNKQIFVNNELKKEDYILNDNDILGIDFNENIDFKSWDKPLEIAYEDDYFLIVNKPVGILIHPDGSNSDFTLVNMVANYYQNKGIQRNVRYIHRIDVETSGIVVFAKDYLTYCRMNYEIENHIVQREYLALVEGNLSSKQGKINAPIGRDRHVQNKFRVGKSTSSKEAITNYYLVKNFNGYALVRLLLETGRTHQIRVHMASVNHPLLGDTLYGGKKNKINRVALHSYRVTITNPYDFTKIVVKVNPCKDMLDLVGGENV